MVAIQTARTTQHMVQGRVGCVHDQLNLNSPIDNTAARYKMIYTVTLVHYDQIGINPMDVDFSYKERQVHKRYVRANETMIN